MDSKRPSSSPSKRKFTPKAPVRKSGSIALTNEVTASHEKDEDAQAKKLISKFNENLRRPVPKFDKKSSVHVAFGGVGASSTPSIRSFGGPGGKSSGGNGGQATTDFAEYDRKMVIDSSTLQKDKNIIHSSGTSLDAPPPKEKKDYKEPWDYNSNYPITLPLREPHSGDPELLNEAEFGEAARNLEYDEKTINAASDLGLLEESNGTKLFLIKLPEKLPFVKREASAKGKEKAESSTKASSKGGPENFTALKELPSGYMGKMLVYKSGAIKWKLGEVLFDVSPGSNCIMAENVMAINTTDKSCCNIGELCKHIVVTPDIDSLLKSDSK